MPPPSAGNPDDSDTPQPAPGRAWTFAAWTFGIGWAAAALAALTRPTGEPDSPGTAILIGILVVVPLGVTGWLARRWDVSLADWGLCWPGITPILLAPLVALAIIAFATSLPVLFGISELELSGMGEVQRLAEEHRPEALELHLELQDSGSPVRAQIVVGLIGGMVLGLLVALLIELPWRGLLLTELSGHNYARSGLMSAAIAALWWFPLQLGTDVIERPGTSLAAVTLLTYAFTGVLLAWMRLHTGSIYPGGVLLAAGVALSPIPSHALIGGSRLQIQLFLLATVALVAAASFFLPPRPDRSHDGEDDHTENDADDE